MKSTGIVRKVDHLGRIVVPKELRRSLDISENDPMEVFVDGERVILQKYRPAKECIVTGEIADENKEYTGGIVLSDKGADQLLKELQEALDKK
ncbi:AbrB/MazE/SpoVT family DNA-binding domain-containing protein [Salimicrobium halophilum]|uniref:Transcriptional pleiotropic regulator of transition state genes n=1 Tax=Salimicrobium halophilum TaxID=86666 RepID=A0A1G8U801_9BACI|nr:AbrB/MazE/SpoVT family DNA-binding domain-containing protein [Salimicrobium halophilum]SDJ49851.1 transcriptional pleiotropic regulator of transition state genes [Salimicrobium halophilum]